MVEPLPSLTFRFLSWTLLCGVTVGSSAQAETPAVTAVQYDVQTKDDRLEVVAELTIRNAARQPQSLSLNLGSLTLHSATMDGREAVLRRDRRRLRVRCPATGKSRLRMRFSTRLWKHGKSSNAVMPLVTDAPATMRVTVGPKQWLEVGGTRLPRKSPATLSNRYEFPAGNHDRVSLRITTGEPTRKTDAVALATSEIQLSVSQSSVRWQSETTLRIVGRSQRTLQLSVPGALKVSQVSAAGLVNSQIAEAESEEGETKVTLTFAHPLGGRHVVTLQGTIGLGAESLWNVPQLKFAGVDAHSGRIVVRSPKTLGMRVDEFSGVSERKLPGRVERVVRTSAASDAVVPADRRLGFDFWHQDFELSLAIPRKRSPLAVNSTTAITIDGPQARMRYRAKLDARRYPRRLRIDVPAGWIGLRIHAQDRPLRWSRRPVEAGVQRLVIDLPRRPNTAKTNAIDFELSGRMELESNGEAGRYEMPLPHVRIVDADVTQGTITIGSGRAQHVAATALQHLRAVAAPTGGERLAWRYTTRAGGEAKPQGTVKIRSGSVRPHIDSLCVIRAAAGRLRTDHHLRIRPAEAAVRSLTIVVQSAAKADVDFQWTGQSKRVHAVRENRVAGRETWKVTFSPPIEAPGVLRAVVSSKRTTSVVDPHVVKVEEAIAGDSWYAAPAERGQRLLLSAERSAGKSSDAVSGYRLKEVAAVGLPKWARSILEDFPKSQRLQGVYRVPPEGFQTRVAVTKPRMVGSRIVVEQLFLNSRLSSAGILQTRATLFVAASGRGRIQVALPENATLKSASIDGKPVQLSRHATGNAWILPPLTKRGKSHRVELNYDSSLGRLSGVQTLRLPVPTFTVAANDAATSTRIVMQEAEWLLAVSRGIAVIDGEGTFETQSSFAANSWLATRSGDNDAMTMSEFRFVADGETQPELSLTISDSGHANRLRWAVLLAVTLLLWRLRKIEFRYRSTAALSAVVVAAVLLLWAPATWSPWLDGLLLGGITGPLLWAIPSIATAISARFRSIIPNRRFRRAAVVTTIVLAVSGGGMAYGESPISVSSAQYDIRITSASQADVNGEFRVHNAGQMKATALLPIGRIPLKEVEINEKPGLGTWSIDHNRRSNLKVELPRAGWNTVRVRFALPIQESNGVRVFRLPSRPVASGRAVIQELDGKTGVRFTGLEGTWRRIADKSGTRIEFPVDRSNGIAVHLDSADRKPAAAKVDVRSETDIEISDHGVTQHDQFLMNVRSGAITAWTFQLPAERKLLAITGDDVAGWSIEEAEGDRRTVRLHFRREVRASTGLAFETFLPVQFADEPVPVAFQRVTPTNVTTSHETVTFVAANDWSLNESSVTHARRIPPARLRNVGTASPPARMAYRLTKPDSNITLRVSRPKSRIEADAVHNARVAAGNVSVTSRMRFRIAGSPRSRLAVFLPEGFSLKSLTGDQNVEWSFGEDKTMLNLTWPQPHTGTLNVALNGSYARTASSPTAEISLPSPMGVAKIQNIVNVRAPAMYEIAPGEIDGWTPIRNRAPGLTFRGTEPEASPIGIKLKPKASKIAASTVTIIDPKRDGAHYTIVMRWSRSPAASRLIAFQVPAWLRPYVRVPGRPGHSAQRDPRGIGEDDPQRWFVTQFGKPGDDVVVVATAEIPWSVIRDGGLQPPAIALEHSNPGVPIDDAIEAEYAPVGSQKNYLVLLQRKTVRLRQPDRKPGRPVSAESLPGLDRISADVKKRVSDASSACFELPAKPEGLAWKRRSPAQPLDANAVVQTVLTTVTQRNGRFRTRAVYRVRNAGLDYLALAVPDGVRLSNAKVDGRPVGILTHEQANEPRFALIPLARETSNETQSVTLQWSGRLPPASSYSEWSIPGVQVVTPRQHDRLGRPVGGTRWIVELPAGVKFEFKADPEFTNVSLISNRNGRTLTFEKPGGRPRLKLAIRTHASVKQGWTLFASFTWIAVAAFGLAGLRRLRSN